MSKIKLANLIPFVFLLFGTYFTFAGFWNGFDSISGDLADSRFNMTVFEHTWHWLKGDHSSLFDMPMFYPHRNVYAYSDYLMGFAPIYWLFRWLTDDMHRSFQFWLVVCAFLNFGSYYLLSRRFFKLPVFWASFASYVFSFGVPRTSHLYHVQTFPQFFVVISAMGLLLWKEKPESKAAPWLFLTGGMLQFISAFYWIWFWVLILFFYSVWSILNSNRRSLVLERIKRLDRKHLIASLLVNLAIALPFLLHYIINAKELGRHGWVSISETVPRIYSWLFIAKDHWQWAWTPFKGFIQELPFSWEHNQSLGILTWIGCILSMFWIWKKKLDLRFLLIPIFATFFLTLTSGRFSTWVLITYLFPAGGAIRAVGRIQIFLLMFWALILTMYLAQAFESKSKIKKWMAVILMIGALSETVYTNTTRYSRQHSLDRIQHAMDQITPGCNLTANPNGFLLKHEEIRLDTVLASFQKGIPSMNGYSGHDPAGYADSMLNLATLTQDRSICMIRDFNEDI
jgi:hypothetical protein